MEPSADDAPPLVATPRHLRRRALHEEIPDALLVPGVEPLALERAQTDKARRQAGTSMYAQDKTYRRKRMFALLAVVFVALSIPVLVISLIIAG